MTTNPMPKAKTERLIVREIDGETLVYDRSRDAASCLNEFAARVWRECDGETSVAAIAAALGEDERAVWLALHQLTKAQLLTEAIAFPPDMSAAKSRREIGGRLGLGAAAFVASIVAPMPAQAASCLAGLRLQPCTAFGATPLLYPAILCGSALCGSLATCAIDAVHSDAWPSRVVAAVDLWQKPPSRLRDTWAERPWRSSPASPCRRRPTRVVDRLTNQCCSGYCCLGICVML